MKGPLRSIVSVMLIGALSVFGWPTAAQATTFSNGVTITEVYSASSLTNPRTFTITHQGETMTVTHGGTRTTQTILIDDRLTIKNYFTYNSAGDKILDRSVVSYGGKSVTRYGHQLTAPPVACPVGETCEDTLHPKAQAQIDLIERALNNLHSAQFLSAVESAGDEVSAQGALACIGAVVTYVASTIALAGCVAVLPCVGLILLHVERVINLACECSGYDC